MQPGRLAAASAAPASGHRRDARRAVRIAARGGYVAKGAVYTTVGALAVMTAFGFRGGRIAGTRSAIEFLQSQPFGNAVLLAVAVGLCGFVVWRFVQAVLDAESKGGGAKGLARRFGLAVSGVTYGVLALFACSLLLSGVMGTFDTSGGGGSESAATLMRYEFGIWMVGIVGVCFVGAGCYQAYRAFATPFKERWDRARMSSRAVEWSTHVSRFGIAVRAVSFGFIGWFFIQAAVQADPAEARGLAGTLRAFSEEPYGALWLGVVGTGFVCYGLYCFVNARFRRIAIR